MFLCSQNRSKSFNGLLDMAFLEYQRRAERDGVTGHADHHTGFKTLSV